MQIWSRSLSAGDLLALEHKGRRLDILVEGIRRIGKAALRVRAVVELHGHVKHDEVRGGYASARPRLEQRARRGVRPGRSGGKLLGQCSGGRGKLLLGNHVRCDSK